MRTDYIDTDTVSHLLWGLQRANRLVCELALQTGWRVGDILEITTEQVEKAKRMKRPALTIIEQKTGKRSRRAIPPALAVQLADQAGRYYCFEGRDDPRKHRSRQAVYVDLRKTAKRFGIRANISPHSLRKNYAVYDRKRYGAEHTQRMLNHDNALVTMLYAYADELTALKR